MRIHGIELKVTCPAVGTLQHLGGISQKRCPRLRLVDITNRQGIKVDL